MSKRTRPNLRDYLRTGKVRAETEPGESSESAPGVDAFLRLLTRHDLEVWRPMLRAGTAIQELPLDFVSLREDFRTMDRTRFTCYILEREGEPLRPVRTSVQIREPLLLALKWDELGTLTLYSRKLGDSVAIG
ncbi:MAG: hypothetical protein LBQ42_13985 [Synergistaceae bacterium]|nr:hypothetical protein [Synergistaceae bacterium]